MVIFFLLFEICFSNTVGSFDRWICFIFKRSDILARYKAVIPTSGFWLLMGESEKIATMLSWLVVF